MRLRARQRDVLRSAGQCFQGRPIKHSLGDDGFPSFRELQIITAVLLTMAEPPGEGSLGPGLPVGGELHAYEEHLFPFFLSGN